MEAELYFSAYDALHQGNSAVRRLELRLQNVSNIGKIVWSSFDFMCGPEMKFVWEVTSSSSVSPVNLSGEDGSVNDAESLDSSMSTQSAQYEDIDNPLEADLTCTSGAIDDSFLDDSIYHEYRISSRNAGIAYRELRYLDEFMVDSHYSKAESNDTMTDSSAQEITSTSRSVSASTTETLLQSAENVMEPRSAATDESAGPIDPMVGTPMELMNISTLLSSDNQRQLDESLSQTILTSRNSSESSTTDASKASSCSFSKLSEDGNANEEGDKNAGVVDSGKVANALTTSCVDSGIGGTISTHSELSASCFSPSAEVPANPPKSFLEPFKNYREQQSSSSTPGSFDDEVVSVLDLPIAPREDSLADELFTSKFVLAEQVFSTQLPSNPLMHKITVVPSRNLLVGSYIFSVTARDGNRTIHAISFLMGCCKQEWYLERQSFLESVVIDAIPKIKAAMLVEDWDDVVVRANAEITRLMHLVTVLDRYPIVSDSRPLLIKNSLLTGKRCHSDKVLCKAISGVLQSQGYCVIIGSNSLYVSKLLNTLAAFVPQEVRWCCLRMYRHKFSPYVRLQAVRRCELPYVMQCGALSNWPICVVDVDRATVCMSPPYSRHRVLKQRADAQRLSIILDSTFRCKPVTLEMTSCRVLECVKTFLRRVDALPLEESARMGLVNQLMLYVENAARALILYVQHASEPLPSEKTSATKSSRFSLTRQLICRNVIALNTYWFRSLLVLVVYE
ncbi:hypothetical protein GCK32_005630 [Trichostrongylus colubriformis]|uniref:Uncharacterized protein n=1 Tax=Trichostrongylus colubriformis TaxID=6319 RepID=A0AAN8GC43_TRICO